jgi:hypothetical protein
VAGVTGGALLLCYLLNKIRHPLFGLVAAFSSFPGLPWWQEGRTELAALSPLWWWLGLSAS